MSKCVCHINGYELKDAKSRSDIATLKNDTTVLASRMNTFTAVSNEDTEGNTELLDMRVDFIGREHATAGDSVRNTFSELFSVVGCGKNLFNPNDPDIVFGMMFDENGDITVTNVAYMISGYIPVEKDKTYYFSFTRGDSRVTNYCRQYALYNENKELVYIKTNTLGGYETIPNNLNVKYARLVLPSPEFAENPSSDFQVEQGELTAYEPFYFTYKLNENVLSASISVDEKYNNVLVKTSNTINLFNPVDVYENKILSDTTPGNIHTNTSYVTTKPINIKGYDYVACQNKGDSALPRAIAFYDSNNNIKAHYSTVNGNYPEGAVPSKMEENGSVSRIPVPEGAVSVCVSIRKDTQLNSYMIYGIKGENVVVEPIPYVEYSGCYRVKQQYTPNERFIKSYFNGKKVVTIGDSITEGYTLNNNQHRWAEQVAGMFNMSLVNYGIGGSEIAQYEEGNNLYNPMCIRYADMDNDADLVIVAGGTNDWNHNQTVLGEFGDTSINTFYGALDTLCKGLLTKYVGKNIMFITPIKRWHQFAVGSEYYNPNTMGYTLEEFVNAIKKVCGFYGIPVLDMFNECNLNPIISGIATAYIPDGTHPNYEGHKIMARQIAGFISKLANDIDYN